jgi:hypothetical protein
MTVLILVVPDSALSALKRSPAELGRELSGPSAMGCDGGAGTRPG